MKRKIPSFGSHVCKYLCWQNLYEFSSVSLRQKDNALDKHFRSGPFQRRPLAHIAVGSTSLFSAEFRFLIKPSHFLSFAGNDLDSIRALFSEKEKELSLAVAKVEALTRQLEEIRRDRHGTLNLMTDAAANSTGLGGSTCIGGQRKGANPSSAARELEKLRRELMVITFIACFSAARRAAE